MIRLSEVFEAVKRIAPEELQEDWDNSGIQVAMSPDTEVGTVLTCLEISDSIIEEAIKEGAEVIVTHHPLLFSKINRIDADSVIGRQLIRLIQSGISVYSAHTSFDSAKEGTNQYLAEAIGLKGIRPLIEAADMPDCGMGRTGSYESPLSFDEFMENLSSVCTANDIRIAGPVPETVNTVALCTGAGSEFIDMAEELGYDVYITGDVKYHDARHADDIGQCVIDAGHYGTEVMAADNLALQLKWLIGDDVRIVTAATDINPFKKV